MSKSIRLSDELLEQAKASADLFHRSPPQQIEHWAQIGRIMESALSYPTATKVKVAATRSSFDAAMALPGTPEGAKRAHRVIGKTSARGKSAPDR